ncbi:hypothetical protein GXP67_21175 [Rhodocytophaga rosea]|uniref:Uncharacterized protein n=1 Tax=Rhodocytophaga rosea TaxID=2704465 RepID=A0A6C0GMW9_9BACT|nr:hypothetical protein [Rhodocytophaga rosea]QHT68983.1 hypothetical protein GXP67_21175 [Rhodocytophaga rosea]
MTELKNEFSSLPWEEIESRNDVLKGKMLYSQRVKTFPKGVLYLIVWSHQDFKFSATPLTNPEIIPSIANLVSLKDYKMLIVNYDEINKNHQMLFKLDSNPETGELKAEVLRYPFHHNRDLKITIKDVHV